MRAATIVAALTIPTFVCAIGTSPTSSATFIIVVGQTTHSGAAVVTFHGVVSDSRCPLNLNCVWAGEATAEFTVQVKGVSGRYQLQLNDPAKRAITHRGVVVEFQGLVPHPVGSQPTDPETYRATIKIR